jgi:hypothetical protein
MNKIKLNDKCGRGDPLEFSAGDVVLAICSQESTAVYGAIESLEAEFLALQLIVARLLTQEQLNELAGELRNWETVK